MAVPCRTKSQVEEVVLQAIAENLGLDVSDITLDSDFERDLNADSLDAVSVIVEVQDKFGITIPNASAQKIRTARQLSVFVSEQLSLNSMQSEHA